MYGSNVRIILLILGINTLLALIMLCVSCFLPKGTRATVMQYALIVLFCPLIGLVFLGGCAIISHMTKESPVDMSDISFDKSREAMQFPPDREAERNLTSVDDSVTFSDTASMRRLMIEVLKRNRRETLTSVAQALESQDTETSHYAASAVQDALSDFRETVHQLQTRLLRTPDDVELNLRAYDFVCEGLSLGIMTPIEQRSYIYIANDIAQLLFEHNVWHMTAAHYLRIVTLLLSVNDLDLAQIWCERAAAYRGDKLETYKAQLHCYYCMNKSDDFFALLEQFKKSGITADEEMLRLIRLFQQPKGADLHAD